MLYILSKKCHFKVALALESDYIIYVSTQSIDAEFLCQCLSSAIVRGVAQFVIPTGYKSLKTEEFSFFSNLLCITFYLFIDYFFNQDGRD